MAAIVKGPPSPHKNVTLGLELLPTPFNEERMVSIAFWGKKGRLREEKEDGVRKERSEKRG